MRLLYEIKNYRLEGQVVTHRDDATLELYQTFPEALHPRAQRITQLTLSPEGFSNLVSLAREAALAADIRKE